MIHMSWGQLVLAAMLFDMCQLLLFFVIWCGYTSIKDWILGLAADEIRRHKRNTDHLSDAEIQDLIDTAVDEAVAARAADASVAQMSDTVFLDREDHP